MNGRFFLDTNVFVYSFDQSAPAKARKATELIRRAVASGKGIVSYPCRYRSQWRRGTDQGGSHPMGETQNQPFQL